jgi:hypothetical protein
MAKNPRDVDRIGCCGPVRSVFRNPGRDRVKLTVNLAPPEEINQRATDRSKSGCHAEANGYGAALLTDEP